MKVTFIEFLNLGRPQWRGQPDIARKIIWGLLGAPDIHTRIRNAYVCSEVLELELQDNSKVLDLGCGRAVGLFHLARRLPSWEFTGIELDTEMYSSCVRSAEQGGYENLHFKQSDLNSLEYNQEFSLALCSDVLEHLQDDVGFLRQVCAALKPGGVLIIHVPRRRQDQWRLFNAFHRHTVDGHIDNEYTVQQLETAIEVSDFSLRTFRYTFGKMGEIAFEVNHAFWERWSLRQLIAVLTFPLTIFLGYLEIMNQRESGNSILAVVQKRP